MARCSLAFLVCAIMLGQLVGCGEALKFGEVKGAVYLVEGGEKSPLPNVMVRFMPNPTNGTRGEESYGITDDAGRYQLKYVGERSDTGSVVGQHRVVIEDLNAENRDLPREQQRIRIDLKYLDPATTPLKEEVREGSQTIDFELKPASE